MAATGTRVGDHALVAGSGKSEEHLMSGTRRALGRCAVLNSGMRRTSWTGHRAMVSAFVAWRSATRHELTEIGTGGRHRGRAGRARR